MTAFPYEVPVIVDGETLPSPAYFDWTPGSLHSVEVPAIVPIDEGTRYLFEEWNDGGGRAHGIVAEDPNGFHVARFDTSFFLTMLADDHSVVTPESGWYDKDRHVWIEAFPDSEYVFLHWEGVGEGSYSGPLSRWRIVMWGPIQQTAVTLPTFPLPLTMIATPGGTVTPESGEYSGEVAIQAFPGPYHAFDHWVGEGAGSYTGPDVSATVTMLEPITQTAVFEALGFFFPLTMIADPGGSVSPSSGDYPMAEPVTITATPDPGYVFAGWTGLGEAAYFGPDSVATIVPVGPTSQRGVFIPVGRGNELTISASDSDPYVQEGPVLQEPRNLYLWATCMYGGISAFEGDVGTELPVLGFTPLNGVLNLGTGESLLLIVPQCPQGEDLNYLLGYWTVFDVGGTFCLQPSVANGFLGPVDCHAEIPHIWSTSRIYGFSSGEDSPCVLGELPCVGPVSVMLSQLSARVGKRSVIVSWKTSAEVDHDGFHVYRGESLAGPPARLTQELVRGNHDYEFVDDRAEGNREYFYWIGAVDLGGAEDLFGPTSVTTPPWPPLVTSFSLVRPNPSRGRAEFEFALASPGRADVSIFNVQGRLVRRLVDGELPAGEHEARWDGSSGTGARVPAGIYFVRMIAPGFERTQKLVFLR